jgi:hypothetical protein
MSTPEPPTAVTAPEPQPPRRRFRFTRTGVLLAVAALAVLVVGGVIGALAFPRPAAADVPRPGLMHAAPGAPAPGHRPGRQAGPAPDRGPGHGRGGPALAGVVVSTGNGTLVVTPDGGAQRTLKTDATTRVQGPGKPGLNDLKAGQRVVVRVTGTGDAATVTDVRVVQAHVTGTVTAVNGNTATVTSYDGLAVQVDVTALTQKPAVGDVVELSGTASGATLTATTVRELPKAS